MLVVDGNSYPAHSQFVASCSRLMYRLIEDCPGFTRHQPLVISSALKAYKHTDAHTILKHVYTDCKVTSNTEALQLLTIADQFDSPLLMEKAIVFLEAEGNGSFLQADCGSKGVLHWLHIADRFGLVSFKTRCIRYAADHFVSIKKDSRLLKLPADTNVALMEALQSIIERRGQLASHYMPEIGTGRTDRYWQSYFCCNSCPGHKICWNMEYRNGRCDSGARLEHNVDQALCQCMSSVDLKQVKESSFERHVQLSAVPRDREHLISALQKALKPRSS